MNDRIERIMTTIYKPGSSVGTPESANPLIVEMFNIINNLWTQTRAQNFVIKSYSEREAVLYKTLEHIAAYKESLQLWKDTPAVDASFIFELAQKTLLEVNEIKA